MTVGSPARLLSALVVATLVTLPMQAVSSTADPVVYTSGSHVQTWDPILPDAAYANWETTVCTPTPIVGLDANWLNPHGAYQFGTNVHPWQPHAGFIAQWINAWANLNSKGPSGHNWTRYSTVVEGNGDFVLNLLADNCSWVYLDDTLVGFQAEEATTGTFPVSLDGQHRLDFIIFDGGGLAGGMYRLETNIDTVFPDSDNDDLTDAEELLYGTDPYNWDTDGDGISDGDEVANGTNPLVAEVVVSGTCVTTVANQVLSNGATFNDLIATARAAARNHGQFVNAVTQLAAGWRNAGLISGRDHGAITSCVARSK